MGDSASSLPPEALQTSARPQIGAVARPAPFLRWAGSKRQHSAVITTLWNSRPMPRYVEPFAGSAAVFFAIDPRAALLADLNEELVRTFQTIRTFPTLVADAMGHFAFGREAYYRVRALVPESLTCVERAARFIYLNRFCFNGLYRTNRCGRFNVPYGAPKTNNLPDQEGLAQCATALATAEIICADFRSSLAQARPGDFVYLDPPYAVRQRRVFREYDAHAFSAKDLVDLASSLTALDRIGAYFVLSYADCREGRLLATDWQWRRVRVRRHVAGFSSKRRNHYELFVSNHPDFLTVVRQHRKRRGK